MNILSSLADARKLMIIDYEFVGWQPRAFDIANYFNETMFINSYPYKNGVGFCLENFITDDEQKFFINQYLTWYY